MTTPTTVQTIKPAATFSVYYRKGGTVNFKWHMVLERYSTPEEAQVAVSEIGRTGYKALYAPTSQLLSLDLPYNYEG